ncbi:arylamine N-acetyltransferase family protein [Paenibacillus mendelii]|uniref:Arylamine N-acetyltransferase n=1 Tax=Paenibacillus mendelii TaxID=206163 RepID=A0ABV6JKZ7_9BACL|nr:arylamine N-acetyltransferase [Paenibacillus mendelii]MCQ6560579.1 arylamine N-acetyltransferase [Paenibacillus mendelii]
MNELNALFRTRIGLSANERLTFESLDHVLALTAAAIPFENLRIMDQKTNEISIANLTNNLLVQHEGGLCYELNTLLYLFLIDNGFDAVLTRGVVYNYDAQAFVTLGRTHVTLLLMHEGQAYLVDTGFGGNLPLKPVPLTGETITSTNGEFRVVRVDNEHGDHRFEMKLKHKHADWRIGYAFDSRKPVTDLSEFNEIQRIIAEHPQSSFNKHPLLTKLTERGSLTLTNTSITQWEDGIMTKENIDDSRFKELLKQHFGR